MGVCSGKQKSEVPQNPQTLTESINLQAPKKNWDSKTFSDDYYQKYIQGQTIGKQFLKINLRTQQSICRVAKILSVDFWQAKESTLLKLLTLDHPNILPIIEIYKENGSYYLVSDFIDGGDCLDYFTKVQTHSESDVRGIVKQILIALHYLHENQLVHGSLQFKKLRLVSKTQVKLVGYITGTTELVPRSSKQQAVETAFKAPELIGNKQPPTDKSDIWALGILMHYLLLGRCPYAAKNESQLQQEISRGAIDFHNNEFQSLSKECKAMLVAALNPNPKSRPSAQALSSQPWLKQIKSRKRTVLQGDVVQSLRRINVLSLELQQCTSKLQEATRKYMAEHVLQDEQRGRIIEIFQEMDKDGNGKLSKDEIIVGLNNLQKPKKNDKSEVHSKEDYESLIGQIMTHENDEIHYTEFVNDFFDSIIKISVKNLKQTFSSLDRDGSGFLTYPEVRLLLLGMNLSEDQIKEQLALADLNKDGKLSFSEFATMMGYEGLKDNIARNDKKKKSTHHHK